jgi:hypothetical protein
MFHNAVREFAKVSPTLGWYLASKQDNLPTEKHDPPHSDDDDETMHMLYDHTGGRISDFSEDAHSSPVGQRRIKCGANQKGDGEESCAAKWKAEAAKSLLIGEELRRLVRQQLALSRGEKQC